LHRESMDGRVGTPPAAGTMENEGKRAESFILGTGVVTQTGARAMWRDGHSVPLFPFESTN